MMLGFFAQIFGSQRDHSLSDDIFDLVPGLGASHHHHHQMAQLRQARVQREQDAVELIERGFAACDRRLTEGLARGGPASFLRTAHKIARREVLRVAISLQGRDSVDAALRRLTGQCPYRDYDISYNER